MTERIYAVKFRAKNRNWFAVKSNTEDVKGVEAPENRCLMDLCDARELFRKVKGGSFQNVELIKAIV